MQKFLVLFCLFTLSFSVNALSADAQQLKDNLALFEQINATFIQRVSSAEGKLLNESTGEMTISRPGKFYWQVITPEEDLIVSNGKTIWYYSPFIEQVTVIDFDDAITGTPFALLAGATPKQWADYVVTKKGNLFSVTNQTQVQASTFIFEFDKNNNINKFVVIEQQGQRSEFLLTHKPIINTINNALFEFKIPTGVEVDDQR